MKPKRLKVCNDRKCPELTRDRWCPAHAQEYSQPRASTTERGYNAAYRRLRKLVLLDGPACVYCGKPATTADHWVPTSKGGHSDLANLVPACDDCNTRKGAKSGEEFIVWLAQRI